MRRAIPTMLIYPILCSPVSADAYRFETIDFPGSIFTDARGINARGYIVGRYTDADEVTHGFLLRHGVFTSIDVPDASVTYGARVINARGDIVGSFEDADAVPQGYLLSDGQFTEFDYSRAGGSNLFGVNNAGDLTGRYFDDSGNERGFIYSNEAFHEVSFPGSESTVVFFAQDNGRVLVGQVHMPPDGASHGFVRNQSGDFRLIDFPGTRVPCTGARWINQRGDIVGFYMHVNNVDDCIGDRAHGFLLRDGEYKTIDVPGATATRVLAINDDGVIVGNFDDPEGSTHGFKAVPRN